MAEALANVKRDLGCDAVILQTRTVRKGGFMGIGAREVVEITAADDVNVLPRSPRISPQAQRANALARMFGGAAAPAGANSPARPQADATPSADNAGFSTVMTQELAHIREMVATLVTESRSAKMGDLPEELFEAYLQLLESEVAEELASQLVQSLRTQLRDRPLDRGEIRDRLVDCVSAMIRTAGPVQLDPSAGPRVVALVGPTGVGKTTTIAKLAANFKLREKHRVGLVTIDTYRIAAVNQLATYAQIIDVPLRVVLTPDELKRELDALRRTCDVILMDTAGRSPADQLKLNELRGFLDAARPDETHLVLSSTCSQASLRAAIQRFTPLGVNRVILTKLDEAVSFGVVLEVVRQVGASLSYVTTGQDVSEDIEVSQSRRIAQWIIERSIEHSQLSPRPGTLPRLEVTVDDQAGVERLEVGQHA